MPNRKCSTRKQWMKAILLKFIHMDLLCSKRLYIYHIHDTDTHRHSVANGTHSGFVPVPLCNCADGNALCYYSMKSVFWFQFESHRQRRYLQNRLLPVCVSVCVAVCVVVVLKKCILFCVLWIAFSFGVHQIEHYTCTLSNESDIINAF